MLKILARETDSMSRILIYRYRGITDAFQFPLEESFESAETRLAEMLSLRNKGQSESASASEHAISRRKKKEANTVNTKSSDSAISEKLEIMCESND